MILEKYSKLYGECILSCVSRTSLSFLDFAMQVFGNALLVIAGLLDRHIDGFQTFGKLSALSSKKFIIGNVVFMRKITYICKMQMKIR